MSTPIDHWYLKLSRKFKLSQPWVAGFCIYLKNDWHIYPNFCNISGHLCLWSDSLQNCSVLRIKFLSLKSKENLAQAHYITLSLTEDLVTSVGEQEQWNHQLKKISIWNKPVIKKESRSGIVLLSKIHGQVTIKLVVCLHGISHT